MVFKTARLALALVGIAASLDRSAAQSNPNNENDLRLWKGVDVVFVYSDPSIGSAPGTPPDLDGDYTWKVFPKECLLSATGRVEVSGVEFSVFDTDWSTPPLVYDMFVSRGKASSANPGNIEPDFADPAATLLSFDGTLALPDPCLLDPSLCSGGGCPAPGFVNGYVVDVQIGTCQGDGIELTADGHTNYAITLFLPGGMRFFGAPGACGLGDYTLIGAYSTHEAQLDWLGDGTSAYGGFHLGGAGSSFSDPLDETLAFTLEFCQPILAPRTSTGSAPEEGLAALHVSVGAGDARFGYAVYDEDGIGDMCVVGSTLVPPVAAPGYVLYGAKLLVDVNDPVFRRTQRSGTVTALPSTSWHPSVQVDGLYASTPPLVLPATLAGKSLYSQAFVLDVATRAAHSTQATRTRLYP